MTNPLKIVFLGSGPIAIPILKVLAADPSIELSAVISQIDRPAGRKRILTPTPLAAAALELGLDVIRCPDVNAADFTDYLHSLSADLFCVVSFGQILKAAVLSAPRICCVNVHASLLPRYRGASPIVQAIRNGDNSTGVCFMQMEKGLDSGPVFRTLTMDLNGTEYADALENSMGELAAQYAVSTLHDIASGKLPAIPQNPAEVTVCRKIVKRDGIINWTDPASKIAAMTRAYFPWPGATAECRVASGKILSISLCSVRETANPGLQPGECTAAAGKLIAGCGDQTALEILELIPAGGKRMTAAAFRNGLRGEVPEFITAPEI